MKTGQINVQTENIFPIIKKFLYSDHEIFLRELVSNAVDASQKMKVLSANGEFKGELGELRVDVILDSVGGDVFDGCVRAMNWEGRLLVFGFAAGRIPQVATNLILVKNYSVIGVTFGAQTERYPQDTSRRLNELLKWYDEGSLQRMPIKTFPLYKAQEALHQLATHRSMGKIALTME